jgi:integrase
MARVCDGFHQSITAVIFKETDVLHSKKTSINLADAVNSAPQESGSNLTFAELSRAYCLAICDGSDLRLRKWVSAYGETQAWAFSSEQIEMASQAMIDHGYCPSTVNRDIGTIGSVYKWAKSKHLSPRGFRSPSIGVRRFEEKIRRVHVEREQIEQLRDRAIAVPDARFACFVSLLIDTGARKSEHLERIWSDVDLEKQEILAPTTKNGSPRVLFFSEKTAQLLKRAYPRRSPSALLFEGRVPGQPINFRRIWGVITKEVGLSDLHMHDVRHAAAASLLRAGVTLGVAAQVLGHDPALLARRYGHLETASLKRAQEQAWNF